MIISISDISILPHKISNNIPSSTIFLSNYIIPLNEFENIPHLIEPVTRTTLGLRSSLPNSHYVATVKYFLSKRWEMGEDSLSGKMKSSRKSAEAEIRRRRRRGGMILYLRPCSYRSLFNGGTKSLATRVFRLTYPIWVVFSSVKPRSRNPSSSSSSSSSSSWCSVSFDWG